MTFWQHMRLRQVRVTSRVLLAAERVPFATPLLRKAGESGLLCKMLVGHRRAFPSREQAEAAIRPYQTLGHADPGTIALHMSFAERARPSDYPVLYHLGNLLPELRRIVDIGGNAGNLFYCYQRYLSFSKELEWVVHDLPAALQAGKDLAAQRAETRLRFAEDRSSCGPADLVIFSGSLHYFEAMPPALLQDWPSLPRYIAINRSPMAGNPPVYAVQDAGQWMVTAKVLDRAELLAAMEAAGYELVDEWPAYELSLRIPLAPQASAATYTGSLFRLRAGENSATQ